MSVAARPDHDKLAEFVDGGGVLIRFAGTRLAAGEDDLTPTALRRGGRTLGGALSWETPKHIAPFEPPSPFVGLAAPGEVTVSRQVLAEPEPGLADKTWARLADGTPLVTAVRRGKGLIVLFHVTADTTWSNLPISGLFVEMLRRVVAQAGAAPAGAAAGRREIGATLPPYRTLDGFGVLGRAAGDRAADPGRAFPAPATPRIRPASTARPNALIAVNALAPGDDLDAGRLRRAAVRAGGLDVAPPVDLKPWLLLAALVGFLVDALASLWLGAPRGSAQRRGAAAARARRPRPRRRAPRRARANAAPRPQPTRGAALETHLAYVVTGDAEVDETSRLGLRAAGPGARRSAPRRRSAEPIGARSRARRTGVLSADLLADRRRPAAAAAARRSRASPPT